MQNTQAGVSPKELEMKLGFQRGMLKYTARFLFPSIPPDEGERGKLQVNS